jgi:hypothetical protein
MGVTKSKVQVCRDCKNEKIRRERNGFYSYYCDCLVWRERLKVLEHARKKEKGRRVPLREVSREERVRVDPLLRVGGAVRDLQAAGGVS